MQGPTHCHWPFITSAVYWANLVQLTKGFRSVISDWLKRYINLLCWQQIISYYPLNGTEGRSLNSLGHLQTLSPGSLLSQLLGDSIGSDYSNWRQAAHCKGLFQTKRWINKACVLRLAFERYLHRCGTKKRCCARTHDLLRLHVHHFHDFWFDFLSNLVNKAKILSEIQCPRLFISSFCATFIHKLVSFLSELYIVTTTSSIGHWDQFRPQICGS